MARKVVRKSDEDDQLEGLRSEDGSQPKVEGVKLVEYRRSNQDMKRYMDLPTVRFDSAKKIYWDHMQPRVCRSAKTGQRATIESEKTVSKPGNKKEKDNK